MEQFSVFDPALAGELTIVKTGWANPFFTLTDRTNIYGKLSYSGIWRKTGNIESAQKSWTIAPQKLFKREILITDPATAQTIIIVKTTPWRGKVTLEFPDGQIVHLKRHSLFSKIQSWYSEQYGNILSIESKLWSYKQPFKIIPELNTPKNDINLILLTFIGLHLILIQRAHATAH